MSTTTPAWPSGPPRSSCKRRTAMVKAVRPRYASVLPPPVGNQSRSADGHRPRSRGPVGVVQVGQAGEVEEDEPELKGVPGPVGRVVHVCAGGRLRLGHAAHVCRECGLTPGLAPCAGQSRLDALVVHGRVGEPERLGRLLVAGQQRDALVDAIPRALPRIESRRASGRVFVEQRILGRRGAARWLRSRRCRRRPGRQAPWPKSAVGCTSPRAFMSSSRPARAGSSVTRRRASARPGPRRWAPRGAQAHGAWRASVGGAVGMDADAMADAELDVAR